MTVPLRRSRSDLEQLRRSVAMLSPGHPAMSREDALGLLSELSGLQRDLQQVTEGLRTLLADLEPRR